MVKFYILDKINNFENILWVENNQEVIDDKEVADIFLEYFDSIVPSLELQVLTELITPTDKPDPI